MSERQPDLPNRQTPFSDAFKAFIGADWAPYPTALPAPLPATGPARERRAALSRAFPGERLVVPAGGLKIRSNDTDFGFRPHSAFAHLTGLGTDHEADAALVLEPTDSGHDATLYVRPRVPRDSEEFYADTRVGEMWVGRRLTLEEFGALSGIAAADLADLPDRLRKDADTTAIRIVTAADADLDALVAEIRAEQDGLDVAAAAAADHEFVVALSESRLVKDAFEIEQMREACRQTADGFEAVVADLPEAVRGERGERWIEGIFALHARHGGNDVGYSTIAAAGEHACTLHWIRNDGVVRPGELVLIDAGVELDTLYTADVTRTLPVDGRFTDAQRRVYEAVLEAQDAGIAAAQPGATFSDVHKAAIAAIARHLADWGLLPVSAEESLSPDGGQHRRWMVHGTSHHLGLDVHDCAQARNEHYRQGTLRPGMVITVEPGLYFRSDDLLVPEEFRGIGIRIEDDVLITESGNENLSAALPRGSAEVEEWMAAIWASRAATKD